jgi:Ethanolamine utilization protein EutJ (predicted chaperonin)
VEGRVRTPSAIYVDEAGRILAGSAAINGLAADPMHGETHPKQYVGESQTLYLGDRECDIADAIATTLHLPYQAAVNEFGTEPDATVVTHPARWQTGRLDVLRKAIELSGLPAAELLPEPVGAAMFFGGSVVDVGQAVAVYDLGGGTFDTAILRRETTGYSIAGPPGGDADIGGEAFDARLLAHLGERIQELDSEAWERLSSPEPEDRQAALGRSELVRGVREAKEHLSHAIKATVYAPIIEQELQVSRAELESLIGQDIEKSCDELLRTISDAGIEAKGLAAVYLVGGSSRLPAVAHKLESRLELTPTTHEDPKLVVALGAHGAKSEPSVAKSSNKESVGQIVPILSEIASWLHAQNLSDTAEELKSRAEQSSEVPVSIVVVGETKRGKSSLINALVDTPGLLPVDADVATSVYLAIRHGSTPSATVFADGAAGGYRVPIERIAEYASVAENPDNAKRVNAVEVETPARLLSLGLVLIDTPGVGGLEAGHTEITRATVSMADALIMVVDASAPLTFSELRFLGELSDSVETVLFVLTKTDLHPGWREILAADNRLLQEHAPRFSHCHFYPVSSAIAIEALRSADRDNQLYTELMKESGLDSLRSAIGQDVIDVSAEIRSHNLRRFASLHLTRVQEQLSARLDALKGNDQARATLESEHQAAIRAIEGRAWEEPISAAFSRLRSRLTEQLDAGWQRLSARMSGEIQSGAADPQRVVQDLENALHGIAMSVSYETDRGLERIIEELSADFDAAGGARAEGISVRRRADHVVLSGSGEADSTRPRSFVQRHKKALVGASIGLTLFHPVMGLVALGGLLASRRVEKLAAAKAAVGQSSHALIQAVTQAYEELRGDVHGRLDSEAERISMLMERSMQERTTELADALRSFDMDLSPEEREAMTGETARCLAEAAALMRGLEGEGAFRSGR